LWTSSATARMRKLLHNRSNLVMECFNKRQVRPIFPTETRHQGCNTYLDKSEPGRGGRQSRGRRIWRRQRRRPGRAKRRELWKVAWCFCWIEDINEAATVLANRLWFATRLLARRTRTLRAYWIFLCNKAQHHNPWTTLFLENAQSY
jgi:hypothetical protein